MAFKTFVSDFECKANEQVSKENEQSQTQDIFTTENSAQDVKISS